MKKFTVLLLTVIMTLSLLLSCAAQPDPETAAEKTANQRTETEEAVTNQKETEAETNAPSTIDPEKNGRGPVKIGGVPIGDFSVVIAKEPVSAVKNAAVDLIRLAELAEGVRLPLCDDGQKPEHSIILGETGFDFDALTDAKERVKDDGYALIEYDGDLYISGTIGRGTMNGVYDFAEDYLGIRFYSDTFTYVKYEAKKDVPKDQSTVFNPGFGGRYNWSFSGEANVMRFAKRTRSTSIKYAGSHNLGSLSKTGDGTSPQPCLSDPEIFETVFQSLCKQIEKSPNKTLFHINQNDGGAFCKCAECKAKNKAAGGTAMGSLLMFINDIADAVKEKYPDREIDILTYAYKETTVMPDPAVVKPRDNVVIALCMMDSTCFTHAYNDPECEHNAVSYGNMVNWSKVCKKFCVYDYSYNHASQITSVGPNLDILWDNMQAFRECGCIGLLTEGDHVAEVGEFTELRNYLINSLMWDPDITKEEYYKMWDEFMEAYYGEAAPYLREYIDLMNATSRRKGLTAWDGHTSVYTDPSVFYAPKVDGKNDYTVINKCAELWDAALSCTLTDEQFAHVEKSSLHFRDFQSRYAKDKKVKQEAAEKFKALCDKYTYDYDGKLPPVGKTDGADPAVPSEGLEIRVAPDGSCYVSGRGDFDGGMLVIPTEYEGKKVTTVGKSALSRATCITELHVPEGIKTLSAYAFRGCSRLKTVYLPASLEKLGYGALGVEGNEHYQCASLMNVYYAGTKETWEKLYKPYNGDWKTLDGIRVRCSDGDILIGM